MTHPTTVTARTTLTVPSDGFDFHFAQTHYIIYPWIQTPDALSRVLRRDEHPIVAHIAPGARSKRNVLSLRIQSASSLPRQEVVAVKNQLEWALGLNDPSHLELARLAEEDAVIAAALRVNQGIRPKRYLDLFEAICGAICAQNVDFRRLFQMMKSLAVAFGPAVCIDGTTYSAFPLAEEVAAKTDLEVRACKVGYRAKLILGAATFLKDHPAYLNREALASCNAEHAMGVLCAIPGIGPYSAGIVLGAGVGRSDIFHLDSFTRQILQTFYFKDRKVNDERLRTFAAKRWPGCAGAVAHLLTTNTEVWASALGHEGFRPSGAQTKGAPDAR